MENINKRVGNDLALTHTQQNGMFLPFVDLWTINNKDVLSCLLNLFLVGRTKSVNVKAAVSISIKLKFSTTYNSYPVGITELIASFLAIIKRSEFIKVTDLNLIR